MSLITLIYPVGKSWVVTQTYKEHVQRAIEHGWCYKPGTCPSGTYYYGGIDYGCPLGTPVFAAADGLIPKLSNIPQAGYGLGVYILHPQAMTTIYGHLSQIKVKVGDKVKQGQLIGYSGTTGNSTGPHLHFELRDPTGLAIDPQTYLTPIPVQPPEPQPPVIIGTTIRVKPMMQPRLRSYPNLAPETILVERLAPETTFEYIDRVDNQGITWVKVACYIAADYVDLIK